MAHKWPLGFKSRKLSAPYWKGGVVALGGALMRPSFSSDCSGSSSLWSICQKSIAPNDALHQIWGPVWSQLSWQPPEYHTHVRRKLLRVLHHLLHDSIGLVWVPDNEETTTSKSHKWIVWMIINENEHQHNQNKINLLNVTGKRNCSWRNVIKL